MQNKVIKCAAYGVAQGRVWRYGWVGLQKLITDLDVGNGHKGGL